MPAPAVNNVILIIIDDIRARHLFHWIDEGKMPNLARLVDTGLSCRNCITTYPSITLPTQPNIMTGTYSGYFPKEGSGIPVFHWLARADPPAGDAAPPPFIRNYGAGTQAFAMDDDLGPNCQTIFEQAGPDEGNSLSVFQACSRGVDYFYPPSMLKVAALFLWYQFIRRNIAAGDWRTLRVVERAFRKPTKFFATNEVPRVTAAYVMGTDALMHNYGYDHPKYIAGCLRCDEYVGRLLDTLEATGHLADTAVCITTDHGNYRADRVHDLEPFFAARGLIPYDPKTGRGDFDAAFGSVGFFNFRGRTWHHHPKRDELQAFKPSAQGKGTLDVLEALWAVPGVQLMFHPDDANTPDRGKIHVARKDPATGLTTRGVVEFEGHGRAQRTRYKVETALDTGAETGAGPGDAFGYAEHESARALLDGGWHGVDEWLAGTHAIDFPIVVDQLPRYFKNPRACDVIVSTCGQVCMNYEHGRTANDHRYSHDVGLLKSMNVPLILGGAPVIPHETLSYCKTTDIVPTLLALLGKRPHASVVGKNLFD